jgi:5'-3' exoribonuclease 1
MNGIIHNCTASESENAIRMKLSPKEVVLRVFQYIDKLFNMAKPRKHFFMAIDGVAPRAKMNQQRQRRYRSAHDADELRKGLISKGEQVPDQSQVFDSNAITPGTEFMAELSKHLHYLIHKKMQDDIRWQQCTVIFSGHSVPGEGEHKIMEFIRDRKMQKGYDANETHCLYGLDADLIMLGLVAHEPHFLLLREDVFSQYRFGKAKESKPLTEKFHLLHLSAMREYFLFEFKDLNIPFKFDLERVIDDFVLMCFFCGNDFIPHMPTLDIKEGAILTLFESYKLVLPTLEGYLTSAGTIHWDRVEVFVRKLGERENSILAQRAYQRAQDEKKDRRRRGGRGRVQNVPQPVPQKTESTLERQMGTNLESRPNLRTNVTQAIFSDQGLTADQLQEQIRKHEQLLTYDAGGASGIEAVLGVSSVMDFQPPSTLDYGVDNPLTEMAMYEEEDEDYPEEDEQNADDVLMASRTETGFDFKKWHRTYYGSKFGIAPDDAEAKRQVVVAYVEALSWVYNYYYQGCISWNWFYRYHYSPIASDLVGLKEIADEVNLDLGTPFHPYEQLLGVLPPKSSGLIPDAYNELMLNPHSAISDFYPIGEIEIDREGTKYEWEGVVKLPFIDEERLLGAVGDINQARLTEDEKSRNKFGPNYVFKYDPNISYTYHSSLPDELPDIANCHCKAEQYQIPKPEKFIPALCNGVRLGNNGLEGFPALFSRNIIADSRFAPIYLFGQASKSPCMVIHLDTEEYNHKLRLQEQSIEEELKELELNKERPHVTAESARNLIGNKVYVGYPYPRLGIVSSLCDETGSYYDTNGHKETHSARDKEEFQRECNYHRSILMKKNGIESGDIHVLVFVKLFKGMEKLSNGSIVRSFYEEEFAYPHQLLVSEYNPRPDPRFIEKGAPALAKEFGQNTPVIFLGGGEDSRFYGCRGRVTSVSETRGVSTQIEIALGNPKTATPKYPAEMSFYTSSKWYNLRKVGEKTGLQARTIGLLMGSIKIEMPDGKLSTAIGLQLRSLKLKKRLIGYCRCEYNEQNLDESYFLNFQTGANLDRPGTSKFSVGGTFGWELSDKAVQLILDFKTTFAELVNVIDQKDNVKLRCFELFPSLTQQIQTDKELSNDSKRVYQLYEQRVREISDWLKQRGHATLPFVSAETDMFPKEVVGKIEEAAIEHEKSTGQPNEFEEYPNTISVPTARFLYKPPDPFPKDLNDRSTMIIGHRVVSISGTGTVPLGHQGILVGIEGESAEVVFDEEFIGGTTLSGKLKTRRGAIVLLRQLLNLTHPRYRSLKPQQKHKFQFASQNAQVPKISAPVKVDPFALPTEQQQQQQQQQYVQKKPRPQRQTEKPVNIYTPLSTDPQTQQQQQQKPRGAKQDYTKMPFDYSQEGTQQNPNSGRGRGRGRGHQQHQVPQQIIPPPQPQQPQQPTQLLIQQPPQQQQQPPQQSAQQQQQQPQQETEEKYLKNWDPAAVFRNKQQKHRQDRKPNQFTPVQVQKHSTRPQSGQQRPPHQHQNQNQQQQQPGGDQAGRGRGRGRGHKQDNQPRQPRPNEQQQYAPRQQQQQQQPRPQTAPEDVPQEQQEQQQQQQQQQQQPEQYYQQPPDGYYYPQYPPHDPNNYPQYPPQYPPNMYYMGHPQHQYPAQPYHYVPSPQFMQPYPHQYPPVMQYDPNAPPQHQQQQQQGEKEK